MFRVSDEGDSQRLSKGSDYDKIWLINHGCAGQSGVDVVVGSRSPVRR